MSSSVYDLDDNASLYQVLNLPRNATGKDIRQAYYKLAVLYHPDKNPDGDELFKEISFAYNILADPEQRAKYDSNTLRSYLHCQARTYDPSMDPNIELSQSELRSFVERIRSAHEQKQQKLSDFERRREEEMKRRAEYDARHPGFKQEYELMRKSHRLARGVANEVVHAPAGQHTYLRTGSGNNTTLTAENKNKSTLRGAGGTAPQQMNSSTHSSRKSPTNDSSFGACHCSDGEQRTTAQLVAQLQEDERRKLYSDRPSIPLVRASNLYNLKKSMMEAYRQEQQQKRQQTNNEQQAYLNYIQRTVCGDAQSNLPCKGGTNTEHKAVRNNGERSCIPFVNKVDEASAYSNTISKTLRTHANFDYLTFVEKDMIDGGVLDGAILADALIQYDRTK